MAKKQSSQNKEGVTKYAIFASKFKSIDNLLKSSKDLVELRINKPREVVLEYNKGKKVIKSYPEFTLDNLNTLAITLASMKGDKFSENRPILSTKIPGGHRVQIMGYSTVSSEFAMSIRINRNIEYSLQDFGMSDKLAQEIIKAVEDKKTILVSGGTGTGKTSLTNALIKFIDKSERIISIEDVEELKLEHFTDKVQMLYLANGTSEKKVNAGTLLRSALRMNPDRILVGEIHVENAETFCSAINTGHEGSIGTIHANDPKGAIASVIMKVIMQGGNDSAIKVLQKQLCQDVYAVLQIRKNKEGKRETEFVKLADFSEDNEITKRIETGIKEANNNGYDDE